MKTEMTAPIRTTQAQKDWLEKEKKRTGNPIAAIIRNLIQVKVEEEN